MTRRSTRPTTQYSQHARAYANVIVDCSMVISVFFHQTTVFIGTYTSLRVITIPMSCWTAPITNLTRCSSRCTHDVCGGPSRCTHHVYTVKGHRESHTQTQDMVRSFVQAVRCAIRAFKFRSALLFAQRLICAISYLANHRAIYIIIIAHLFANLSIFNIQTDPQ